MSVKVDRVKAAERVVMVEEMEMDEMVEEM